MTRDHPDWAWAHEFPVIFDPSKLWDDFLAKSNQSEANSVTLSLYEINYTSVGILLCTLSPSAFYSYRVEVNFAFLKFFFQTFFINSDFGQINWPKAD